MQEYVRHAEHGGGRAPYPMLKPAARSDLSPAQMEASHKYQLQPVEFRNIPDRAYYAIYLLGLAVCVATWLVSIRAPLWLDETVSFFLIKGGWAGIMSRQIWPDSPLYSCLLWLWTKAMGTGEIALRISSLIPMLAATYLLYRAARELFDRDVALIAVIVFCLHPFIIFAAIDVRPYAFAALATNTSILALVYLRHNNSNWLAALFGLSAACIVEFQLLFAVILPALAICFLALKIGDGKSLWRQLGISLAVFSLAFLPVIPRLQYMVHTSGTHVFGAAPSLMEFLRTFGVEKAAIVLIGTLLTAAATRRLNLRSRLEGWPILLCVSLALVPTSILYGLSVGTSIHVFVPRYRLVAVPGIALCWALVISRVDSRTLRSLFCVAVVAVSAYPYFRSPSHSYTWKYALDFAQTNASVDHATMLICSDLPESNYMPMPVGSAILDSGILAPISYYKVSVPVVPLPRAVNEEAMRAGSQFVKGAALRHQRFLALAFEPSYPTLQWLADYAAGKYNVHELGVFDRVKVVEFLPRAQADPSR
jgi:Dolichyl-phosphate-mannose-protein mannosyltransferase